MNLFQFEKSKIMTENTFVDNLAFIGKNLSGDPKNINISLVDNIEIIDGKVEIQGISGNSLQFVANLLDEMGDFLSNYNEGSLIVTEISPSNANNSSLKLLYNTETVKMLYVLDRGVFAGKCTEDKGENNREIEEKR